MAAEVIDCPACRNQVRVPESLLGQPVRCPQCQSYFTAPTKDADGNLGEAKLLPDPPPQSAAAQPVAGASSLFIPGVFLLLVGITGTIVNGYQASQWITDPEAATKNRFERLEQFAKMTQQNFDPEIAKRVVELQQPVEIAVFLISLLPIFGAIAILTTRLWGLAVLGSFIAIINLGNCCCLIGLPAGILCLIRLFDPEIRPLFTRR